MKVTTDKEINLGEKCRTKTVSTFLVTQFKEPYEEKINGNHSITSSRKNFVLQHEKSMLNYNTLPTMRIKYMDMI